MAYSKFDLTPDPNVLIALTQTPLRQMGFNISTGKIGSITTLTTAREDSTAALKVRIDLNELNRSKSYQVTPEEFEKPFEHGTVIEITGWWPEGNSNNGFIKTLARYSTTKIAEEIGRRYASLIRDNKVRIIVNGIVCEAFEFCAWGANRHVTRKKYGEIPARYELDRVIFTQRKCAKCGSLLEGFQSTCLL